MIYASRTERQVKPIDGGSDLLLGEHFDTLDAKAALLL
jgi:hypothetical protein